MEKRNYKQATKSEDVIYAFRRQEYEVHRPISHARIATGQGASRLLEELREIRLPHNSCPLVVQGPRAVP